MAFRIFLYEFISEAICQFYGMPYTFETAASFTAALGLDKMTGDELFALAQNYGFEA